MSGWLGDEIAMVFDGATGNALDSFDYTAEELQRRADELRGTFTVTYSSVPCFPAADPPAGAERPE